MHLPSDFQTKLPAMNQKLPTRNLTAGIFNLMKKHDKVCNGPRDIDLMKTRL